MFSQQGEFGTMQYWRIHANTCMADDDAAASRAIMDDDDGLCDKQPFLAYFHF